MAAVADVRPVGVWAASGAAACSSRGLYKSSAWLAELSLACGGVEGSVPELDPPCPAEASLYTLVKSLFDCREYARAARLSANAESPRLRFLHLYSRYSFAEGRRLDDLTDAARAPDPASRGPFRALYDTMKEEHSTKKTDGYFLYLYGVVLKKLELTQPALRALEEAVNLTPWLWGAWLELASLPRDRESLEGLKLPDHCVSRFFLARAHLEQKNPEDAVEIYESLKASGFAEFSYLDAQMAVAYHDMRDVDGAIMAFKTVRRNDPCRLEDLDIFSHLLYVKDMRTELANLAHAATEIDKYRVETCCIVGNYYSLRGEHQKAVVHFQRALRLNPSYLPAWILTGHEFIELQNTNAAIQSYRCAIEVNRNDYRAWNGLGQAYEILGLNGYCLYYYARAAQQCPNDSRMLVALGEAFEKLDRIPNALKCYHRAHSVGDIEGTAILKLAKLYDRLRMPDSAAAAYSAACLKQEDEADKGLQEAYRYLAHYHLKNCRLDHAAHYAYKCLEHKETKEEGKTLLKVISERRINLKGDEVTDENSARTPVTADATTSPKLSCVTELNYSNRDSPSRSGILSRFKL